MSYFVNPTQEERCVFLTCEGDMTLAEMASVWREVQKSLAETGWKRVLMDITTLRTKPEMGELFDLAKLYWRNFPAGGRIALVIRWDQSRFAKLLEMLVRSVGVYLTVFVSEEQAEAWIRDDSPHKHRSGFKSIFQHLERCRQASSKRYLLKGT